MDWENVNPAHYYPHMICLPGKKRVKIFFVQPLHNFIHKPCTIVNSKLSLLCLIKDLTNSHLMWSVKHKYYFMFAMKKKLIDLNSECPLKALAGSVETSSQALLRSMGQPVPMVWIFPIRVRIHILAETCWLIVPLEGWCAEVACI